MAKRRCVWLLCIVASGAMFIFENGAATLVILSCAVFVPLVFILLSFIGVSHIKAELNLPGQCAQGEKIEGELTIKNDGILSIYNGSITIACRNMLTGEVSEISLDFQTMGKSSTKSPLSFSSLHCGKLALTIVESSAKDIFCLTCFRFSCDFSQAITVYPEIFPSDITITENMTAELDSDRYSTEKPGNDPSEIYNIREYVPGDAIKHIHWKLSQKLDEVMVRDLGLPVANQILLLMESTAIKGMSDIREANAHSMACAFASVSSGLLQLGIAHTVGWARMKSGIPELMEISSFDDWNQALEVLLSNTVGRGESTIAGSVKQFHPRLSFAHIVIVTPYIQPDVFELYNGNRITLLLASHVEGSLGAGVDGIQIIPFDEKYLDIQLGRLAL